MGPVLPLSRQFRSGNLYRRQGANDSLARDASGRHEISIHYMHGQPVDDHQIKAVKDGAKVWQDILLELDPGAYKIAFRRPAAAPAGISVSGGARRALRHPRAHVAQAGPVATHILLRSARRARFLVVYYPLGDFDGVYKFRVMTPSGETAKN